MNKAMIVYNSLFGMVWLAVGAASDGWPLTLWFTAFAILHLTAVVSGVRAEVRRYRKELS